MIYFTATEAMVRQILVNAIRASSPLGESESPPLKVSWNDVKPVNTYDYAVYFYQDRSVHIYFERINSTLWRIKNPRYPIPLLQTWSRSFATWSHLITSARGARVLNPPV